MKSFCILPMAPVVLLLGALSTTTAQNPIMGEQAPFEPTWESLYRHIATPQWYEDAVLGFYFHWGPYSVPAFSCSGYWRMYIPGDECYEQVKKEYGEPGIEFGYKDFIPLWKAPNYDPDEWAALFKYAGADFAGPGAEHHDGFALWDTEFDEWNAKDMGPGIDIVGTLIEAIKKQGLKTCIAWHNWRTYITYDTGRRLCPEGVDVNDPAYVGLYGPIHEPMHEMPINNEYPGADWPAEHWEERMNKWVELVDKYQFDLAWWEHMDSGEPPDELKRKMLAHYFNAADRWGKEVVVSSKKLWENRRQDLPPQVSPINLEGWFLDQPFPRKWQTDIPLGNTWAYTPDVGCKSTREIIEIIVNNVSKNALTLFSVAPKADGSLPEAQVRGLRELGDWMAINKPALYGTVPAPFMTGGAVDALIPSEAGAFRFTRKKEYLFAIALKRPEPPLVFQNLIALEGSEIRMLGSDQKLKWHQEDESLVIEEVPDPLPCEHAWSFKIQILDQSW
jgi:alpha-L-fucosidase